MNFNKKIIRKNNYYQTLNLIVENRRFYWIKKMKKLKNYWMNLLRKIL